MNNLVIAALAVSVLTLAPFSAFASVDKKAIEKECSSAPMEEDLTKQEIAKEIDKCVAEKLAAQDSEGAKDTDETAKPMKSE